jgi:hypothetical protein
MKAVVAWVRPPKLYLTVFYSAKQCLATTYPATVVKHNFGHAPPYRVLPLPAQLCILITTVIAADRPSPTFVSSPLEFLLANLSHLIPDSCIVVNTPFFYSITLRHTRGKMSILPSVQYCLAAGVVVLLIVFAVWTIYSVYFGPLSKFPGPKIAAATLFYEFYYDVILQGRYTFKIRELHKKYGLSQALPNHLEQVS